MRRGLQAVALAVAVLVTVVAVAGPDETARNLAPWVLYVTFWVGLVPASLLLGPVWRVVNPLRLLHRGLRAVLPRPRRGPAGCRRSGCGRPPLSLLVFVWLELVYPDRAEPATRGGLPHRLRRRAARALALWFGEEWFAAGDGFEVYSDADRPAVPVGTAGRRPARAAQPAGQRDGGAARSGPGRGRRRAARVDGVRRPVPHGVLADRAGGGERQPVRHRSACW